MRDTVILPTGLPPADILLGYHFHSHHAKPACTSIEDQQNSTLLDPLIFNCW